MEIEVPRTLRSPDMTVWRPADTVRLRSIKDRAKIGLILGAELAVLPTIRLAIGGPSFFNARLGVPYFAIVQSFVY